MVCGVDDAGRGPVIGPMVLAGVAFRGGRLHLLEELGVRDSKALSPARRLRLRDRICELADRVEVEVVQPGEIDEYVLRKEKLWKLNRLEAEKVALILLKVGASVAYVDASDVDAERFGRTVAEMLPRGVEVISEHHADVKYPIVSAASIVAKVRRDAEVERIRAEYGDFGSGYPSDPKTRIFLQKLLEDGGELPAFVRRSWKTLKKLS
ncbi:MAG: ribonuclease HII [Candidatus Brockarchaeota archaeon]|nr:ribonuclease HII [Candidatus Brockarchaeota archaeon]